ncbi:MAG: hypothetical protein ACTSXN_09485 [Promethearchaeota archaeon]
MSNTNVNLDWASFGSRMKIIAIFVIIPIPFVGLIFTFLALSDIRKVNFNLNNPLIEDYRSKFFTALIFKLIGSVVSLVGLFFPVDYYGFIMSYGDITYLMPLFIFTGIGLIISIIAGIIEMGAWGSFETFFRQNTNMFPAYVAREAEEGSHYLKNAALMYVLGFLIITALIGWIFSIIGYFKVAKLEQVMMASMTTTAAQPTPTPSVAPTSANVKYCPNCGADVTGAGKFCGTCGSALT